MRQLCTTFCCDLLTPQGQQMIMKEAISNVNQAGSDSHPCLTSAAAQSHRTTDQACLGGHAMHPRRAQHLPRTLKNRDSHIGPA